MKQSALENHYTPKELASRWNVSVDTIREIFKDEPGVIKIKRPQTLHKRGYTSLRIPESVVMRVGSRLAAFLTA
jgi:hypothetical protein